MFRRLLALGLLGPLALLGSGCGSRPPTASAPAGNTVATSPAPSAEQPGGDEGAETQQVTVAVSGMT